MNNRDIEILAKTIYGEARGEGEEGMEAVACVVMNRYRAKKWFTGYRIEFGIKIPSVAETCLKPKQFSCWNKNDVNYELLQNLNEQNELYLSCLQLAAKAISGNLEDFTNNATFYHNRSVSPSWAKHKSPCYEVGDHLFYNDVS